MPSGRPRVAIIDDAGGDDDERQDDGVPAPAEEVEIGVGENLHMTA